MDVYDCFKRKGCLQLIKLYDYDLKNPNHNFELRINLNDYEESQSISELLTLITSKVEIDYENHTIRIGFALKLYYSAQECSITEVEIQHILDFLNKNKQREIVIVKYSGYGTYLKSEHFNCFVSDKDENPWRYTWYDSSDEATIYEASLSCNLSQITMPQ